MRRQLAGKFKLNAAVVTHHQPRFGGDVVEFNPGWAAVRLDDLEQDMLVGFLNDLKFPDPGPEVEEVGKVFSVHQLLVACAEHVHVATAYLLQHWLCLTAPG